MDVQLKPGYEEVFTVTEFYDGPRQGVANFKGKPHFYDCIFDETRQNYSHRYRLTPIPSRIFELAIELGHLGKVARGVPFWGNGYGVSTSTSTG